MADDPATATQTPPGSSLVDIGTILNQIARNGGLSNQLLTSLLQTQNSFFIKSTLAVSSIGSAAPAAAVAADATRNVLLFHNPGTVSLVLAPATDINNAVITATFASPAGGYVLLPQDYLPLAGPNVQLAWRVAAQTGTANVLTVGSA